MAQDQRKEFAAAVTEALSHAKHVADRWRLAKNLTEYLEKAVSKRWKQQTEAMNKTELPSEPAPVSSRTRWPRQPIGEARSQQVLALPKAGVPTRTIAKRLGGTQRTILRWLTQEQGTYAGLRKPRRSPLDWSTRYLRERWEAGEHNGTLLGEELKTRGYTGSSRSVSRRLATWRDHPWKRGLPISPVVIPRSPFEDVTSGEAIGWMLARPGTLSPQAEAQLNQRCQMDERISQARELTRSFLDLIRYHNRKCLERWLKDVRASSVREFLPCARRLEQDKTAILAGLSLPYSMGPVEGHITRLKLIKRQAYGRAGISSLQHRFLPAA